jgi:hypothetical protein
MFIFILGVGATLSFVTGDLPQFRDSVESASINLEVEKTTNRLFTQPGSHGFGEGGAEWEKNATTRRNIDSFGFASDYMVIEEDKVQAVQTRGEDYANYSRFRQVEKPEYQYNFRFVWFPLVHTAESFERGSPPGDPPILEPNSNYYDNSGETVYYGSVRLHGETYRFLTTSYLRRYNTTYVSQDWNFQSGVEGPLGGGDSFNLAGETFEITSLQNRGNDQGRLVTLRKTVKNFGASIPQATDTIKVNRYGVYNASDSGMHPVRIEVVAW